MAAKLLSLLSLTSYPCLCSGPLSLSPHRSAITCVIAFPANPHHTSKPSPGAGIDMVLKAQEGSQGPDTSTFIKEEREGCVRVCLSVCARSSVSVCEGDGLYMRAGPASATAKPIEAKYCQWPAYPAPASYLPSFPSDNCSQSALTDLVRTNGLSVHLFHGLFSQLP